MKRTLNIILCAVFLAATPVWFVAPTALIVVGCRGLDPTGVYQGDQFLYQSELAITTSYDLLHLYVKWEADNRQALSTIPEIRKSSDKVRTSAKKWFASAHAAHDAYKLSPTDANKTALQGILDVIRAALTEANSYMVSATVVKAP